MRTRWLAAGITIVAASFGAELTVAGEPEGLIAVEVASGRRFVGQVDARSNNTVLWLRTDHGATRVWRPIRWEVVVRATREGRKLERADVLALASEAPAEAQRRQRPVARKAATLAEAADERLGFSGVPRGITFDARLANWDDDAAADGLLLDLRVVDATGRNVAVDGTVEVQWVAVRDRTPWSGAYRNRSPVQTIARWTRTFTAAEMADGATWQLPFQAFHPQYDRSWRPAGLVRVKVTVPGHGTWVASRDFIRTRPYSPTRDEQARATGSPFFPGERAGR
ncbi:MAG TPA: hypothetical protein ENJ50_01945 [Planctomycetaceae bacterium]|nr:hypothetical protein [Planctomycetaceae bacterium]